VQKSPISEASKLNKLFGSAANWMLWTGREIFQIFP